MIPELTEPIGWQIINPDGTIAASGPITIAELASDITEQLTP